MNTYSSFIVLAHWDTVSSEQMLHYPTQIHYPDTDPGSSCRILVMLSTRHSFGKSYLTRLGKQTRTCRTRSLKPCHLRHHVVSAERLMIKGRHKISFKVMVFPLSLMKWFALIRTTSWVTNIPLSSGSAKWILGSKTRLSNITVIIGSIITQDTGREPRVISLNK